jgi:hypothetical protein
MRSIWTPGGEHEVPRPRQSGSGAGQGGGGRSPGGDGPEAERQLTEDEEARLEEAAREMAAVQAQLAAAPPEQVVANHLIGLYELAAIHLSRPEPNLESSRLAIDALGAVLDACRGRLGEAEATLGSARSQIQLAFVAARQQSAPPTGARAPQRPGGEPPSEPPANEGGSEPGGR